MSRNRLWWLAGAVVSGLAFALLPLLSMRWYVLYPYPLIPMDFWLLLIDRLGRSVTGCLAFLAGFGIFTVASPTLARGKAKVSKANLIGLGILSVLQVAYFIALWKDGIRDEPGPAVLKLLSATSILWLAIVWLFLRRAWIGQSYSAALTYHLVLVLWLLVYAFPWIGKMP